MIFNATSGSNPLNFKVVAGATEPSNPKEYTIWVQTSVSIPWWEMGVYGYEDLTWDDDAGCVYFKTNIVEYGSDDWFNPLKDNSIDLGITETVQNQGTYDNPNWVRCNAYLYKNGAWVQISSTFSATINVTCPAGSHLVCSDKEDRTGENNIWLGYKSDGNYTISVPFAGTWYVTAFIEGDSGAWTHKATEAVTISGGQTVSVELSYKNYLYKDGTDYTSITGGLTRVYHYESDYWPGYNVTQNSDHILFSGAYGVAYFNIIRSTNQIDLTNVDTLSMNVSSFTTNGANTYGRLGVMTGTVLSDSTMDTNCNKFTPTTGEIKLDVSQLSGKYYIFFGATFEANNIGSMKVTEVAMR